MRFFVLLALALCFFAFDKNAKAEIQNFPQAEWNETFLFLFDKESVADKNSLLEAPPVSGSKTLEKEIAYLEVVTLARTQKQEDILTALGVDPVSHLMVLLELDTSKYRQLFNLFLNAKAQMNQIALEEKWRYQRPRPYHISDKIRLFGDKSMTASYPSLYAAQAWMTAHLLTDLFPQYDYVWAGWAKEVSKLYEVAGLQFPSDSEAGKKLSLIVYENYKTSLQFEADMLNVEVVLSEFKPDIEKIEKNFGSFKLPKSFP